MRFFLIPVLAVLVFLTSSLQSAYAITEAGRLQVGLYKLKYNSELPVVDVLEILPNQKFRYWDYGTQKEVFFFEGRIEGFQISADGTHDEAQLIIERDGRILNGKTVSRSNSEFNLRLRHMAIQIYKSFFYTEMIMTRTHSYRNYDFVEQERMVKVKGPGPVTQFEFMGFAIDY